MRPQPGLTPARLRAITEAEGEIIIFVDDENVLDPPYLSESMRIALQFPCLGAWGGQLLPEFEIPPAPGLEDLLGGGLALRELQQARWSNYNSSTSRTVPVFAFEPLLQVAMLKTPSRI